jgi:hypothetical protein
LEEVGLMKAVVRREVEVVTASTLRCRSILGLSVADVAEKLTAYQKGLEEKRNKTSKRSGRKKDGDRGKAVTTICHAEVTKNDCSLMAIRLP